MSKFQSTNKSQDKILIRGLTVSCIVGILPNERVSEQPLSLDIDMYTDFTPAVNSESVIDTVDYAQVSAKVTDLVQQKKFQLLETMAHRILDMILVDYAAVYAVQITIEKPQAVKTAQWVGVTSYRER